MKDFNWKKFQNEKVVVHCKTEELANDFCRQMHEQGMKWVSNRSYLETTNWFPYKENTCYTSNGMFGNVEHYKKVKYDVVEWEE